MECIRNPRLFGINNSNRDFSAEKSWGKNQFNSSFPAALGCYLFKKNMASKYITMTTEFTTEISDISIPQLFNADPLGNDTFYAFESQYTPYQKYYIGSLPRIDLVIQDKQGKCLRGLEIKLTALPDNTTHQLDENQYGSEIVVRPDTIVYLACSILNLYGDNLDDLHRKLVPINKSITDWSQAKNVINHLGFITSVLREIISEHCDNQTPLLIQPIWKTNGKAPQLSDNCLDLFTWSNLGLLSLFLPCNTENIHSINRPTRATIWLFKMLLDGSYKGHFD